MQKFISICCLASYGVLLKKLHFISQYTKTNLDSSFYVFKIVMQDFVFHILLHV